MPEREREIRAFLAGHGFAAARRLALAGDASARRYERLLGGPRPAVLMDAPPDRNDVRPFLRVARLLQAWGLSAPQVVAADAGRGLVLLEDLGDASFSRVLAAGACEDELYAAAIDVLVALQAKSPPADLPPYDDAWLLREAGLLLEWYAPDLEARAREAYRTILSDLLPLARHEPGCFVYVDYHADNLVWLPERAGPARVGLLDFQDARLGPPAYDLVSLLEDARRDVAPAIAQAMMARYLEARPDLDPVCLRTACAILGAQRNAKILGIFTRLARRDGKLRYLELVPRVQVHLARDLAHPALAPLRDWFARYLPLQLVGSHFAV